LPPLNLAVDVHRMWADIMSLAEITDPQRPYTRRSFSPLFLEGRRWLARQFADAGLAVRIDAAGNLIGRALGNLPALGVIAVGSHSDTVPSGGRFDGIAGVVTGLEIIRALGDANIRLDHTVEIIDFLAEEPSEYGLSCVGSRGMSGALDPPMLDRTNSAGEKLRDALHRVGGDSDRLDAARRRDIKAFIELHIEQGIVLEAQSLDVGIVTAIVGIRRIEIVFVGAADHAGTTPMALRKDALIAGANTVASVRRIAEQIAAVGQDYFVATVGVLTVAPGAANVVPSKCRIVIDARTTDPALTERFTRMIEIESARHAADAQVSRMPLTILSDGPPAGCDPTLRTVLHENTRELGLRAIDIASGAGHDAAFMSRICPSGMVLVPCRQGKSHSPEEWADANAIAAGAAVVLQSVMTLDQSLPRDAAAHGGQ
jgi:N-carbamoyl-L-amino-acid hydrolase